MSISTWPGFGKCKKPDEGGISELLSRQYCWDFEKMSEELELGIYKNIKALKYGIPNFLKGRI
ncbi:hypothetical protein AALB19_18025 [Oscillospiraceae bacterium 50-58]